MAKVKIGEMINSLVNQVDEIDASDITQGEKTKKYKAAVAKFKNALFSDKRKYRGKGLAKRITANTYNTYMSRARKRFDDRLHHHFERNVERLADKFPLYAADLNAWLQMPAADIRKNLTELTGRLKDIQSLAEDLTDIKLGTKAAEKKILRLAQKYPAWSMAISDLNSTDWKAARDHLYRLFQQGDQLLGELLNLKVNHEVLYALTLSPSERVSIQKRWGDVLDSKKRATVLIDYPRYMQGVMDILNASPQQFDLTTRSGMAPLAFALAAVSGRRMIEIMVHGQFEVAGKNMVRFTGQAKKRHADDEVRTIYTLCDSELFVDRLNALRSCHAAADFGDIMAGGDENDSRSENGRISSVLGTAFSPWVKKFFNDDRRMFKDSRSIYARIAYERWFRVDPRWKDVDEDVFFSEILGHDDEGTQLHYKQFKLHNFSLSWKPETGQENARLAALQELDDDMPGFARGDAGVRLHEQVKRMVEEDPTIVITNFNLRPFGFNTAMIKRYLEFAADALGQTTGENGRLQLNVEPPQIVLENTQHDELDDEDDDASETSEADEDVEDDEIDVADSDEIVEESEPEPQQHLVTQPLENHKPAAVPRFAAPHRRDDGQWVIRFEYEGQNYAWSGMANSIPEAMHTAWLAYFPDK